MNSYLYYLTCLKRFSWSCSHSCEAWIMLFKSFVVDFVLILFYFIYIDVDKNFIQELALGDKRN